MTTYLYYQDATRRQLQGARVLATKAIEQYQAVALDETIFYPTGGGQPHDTGQLGGVPVVEVQKDEDGTVWHLLQAPLTEGSTVDGEIDWRRRFDFMQHHTGQHILSRAFELVCDTQTVGFHMTENSVTIDLDREDISEAHLVEAEDLANQIVFQNISVKAWFPDAETLASLALRKISDKVAGDVRVVEIDDFDVCACGGTHVQRTGEIGIIKILKTERIRSQTRLEFACGQRALLDFRTKNTFLNDLSAQFTMAWQDAPTMIEKLREENKQANKQLKQLREKVLQGEAERLWAGADTARSPIIVTALYDEAFSPADLQGLARALLSHENSVALLGIYGEKSHVLFACSDDVELDVVPHLKEVLAMIGTQRGGGRPNLAQGGGVPATETMLQRAFDQTCAALQNQ